MRNGWTIVHYDGFNKPIDDYFFFLVNKHLRGHSKKAGADFLREWSPASAFKEAAGELETGRRDFDLLPPWVDAMGIADPVFRVLKVNDWIGYYEIERPGRATGTWSSRLFLPAPPRARSSP